MKSLFLTCRPILLASPLIIATTAQADIRVTFDEGAPKDRFTFENTGTCAISDAAIMLDLAPARGKLIFDVTGQGRGVQVFQPFEVITGADALAAAPQVQDGQSAIRLDIVTLQPGAAIAFTIDVDDTLGQREITVSGSEIEGAMVSYTRGETKRTAEFSANGTAILPVPDCG